MISQPSTRLDQPPPLWINLWITYRPILRGRAELPYGVAPPIRGKPLDPAPLLSAWGGRLLLVADY
jgi:hypothetical protein